MLNGKIKCRQYNTKWENIWNNITNYYENYEILQHFRNSWIKAALKLTSLMKAK